MVQQNEDYVIRVLQDVGLVTRPQIEKARARLNGAESIVEVLIKEGEPPIERPLGEACEVLLRAVSVDYLPHFAPFL